MASCCPESLKNLCCVRIAYLMWTRQGHVHRNDMFYGFNFKLKVSQLSNDIKTLILPTPCEKIILEYVDFSGRQLVPLMYAWDTKTKLEYYPRIFLKKMMYENLVLNSDKLINPRKMAEKILASRILPPEFAFRLASVNFLQNEVLNLWMDVQHYFLDPKVFKKEDDEVILWIYYCLLKMNSISALNYSEKVFFFFDLSLTYCAANGNVAYFDYLENYCRDIIQYSKVSMINYILAQHTCLSELDHQQTCIIFYLKLLNTEEKEEVFREYPHKMVHLYLNWPLSETFVENAEEIWRFIPEEHKSFVFVKIFIHFYGENVEEMFEYHFKLMYWPKGNCSFHHLFEIWDCLWKISMDSHKLPVLNKFVFSSLQKYALSRLFFNKFDASVLKNNLLNLFLSNGKAVFELYKGQNLKESLISLIAKYLPEDYRKICLRYFKETPKVKKMECPDPFTMFIPRNLCRKKLFKDITEMLPSNND